LIFGYTRVAVATPQERLLMADDDAKT